MAEIGDYLEELGELVCAAKDRESARRDQEAVVNSAHDRLFRKIRAIEKSRDDLLAALKLAVRLVDCDIIRVRPSDKRELLEALELWNEVIAKAEQS